jgi:hypothetical protein
MLVLEEAHYFFDGDRARVVDELLSSAVAEQRSMRQSFVFVEQRPSTLSDGVLSNTGSVVAFRNGHAAEARQSADKLAPIELSRIMALPDYCAIVRTPGSAPQLIRMHDAESRLEGATRRPALARSVSSALPWCDGCPAPCRGSVALSAIAQEAVRSQSVDPSPDLPDPDPAAQYARATLSAVARCLNDAGLVDHGSLDSSTSHEATRAMLFCGAGRQIGRDATIRIEMKQRLLGELRRWSRSRG